jgi:hypothetical protein
LDIDIEDNGDGTFSIYYTVKDAGDYTLSVKFGGQPVPDGFYTFTVSAMKVTTTLKCWVFSPYGYPSVGKKSVTFALDR